MTNLRKKQSHPTTQTSIFDWLLKVEEATRQSTPAPSGSMNFRAELCAAMSADIKCAADENGRVLSRFGVSARMSDLLGYEVNASTLDNWTAPSHTDRTPDAVEIAAFVRATGGQRRAIEVITRHAGLVTLPGPDALRAEIRRWEETAKKAKHEVRKREALLKEVER